MWDSYHALKIMRPDPEAVLCSRQVETATHPLGAGVGWMSDGNQEKDSSSSGGIDG